MMATVDSIFTDPHISQPPTFEGEKLPKIFLHMWKYTVYSGSCEMPKTV